MIRNRIAEMLKKGTCVGLAAALIMSATVPAATSVAEAAEPVQNSEVMVNAENASPVSEEKENIDENTTTTTENQNNVSASDNENFIKAESIENIGSLQQTIKLNAKNVSNVPAPQADEIYSTRITLNKHEASIDEGKTLQLTVNSFSGNATNKEIIWTTSDSTVATIDQNGLVTAVGAGDCNITATCVGKNEGMDAPASATCVIHADGIYGDYQYDYLDPEEKTSVRITDYTGSDTEITIPGNINGKVVNEIGTYAFWMDDNITKVVIPEGVTTIGDDAFRGDDNLASITFPSTLKKIGEGAFYSNAFTEVVIPEGTTRIERGAFNDCDQLANVSLPSTLTYIGANAFAGCTALDKIVLPDRISGISTNPFGSGVELIDKIYANAGSTTAKTLEKNNITYIAIAYPQSITLSDSNLELISGKDATLTVTEATGDPEPTNTDVEWKSSDENVATVDENGNIKAVGEGTATITATCVGKNVDEENYASASCTVKVLGIEKNFTYSTNEDNEIVIEGYINGNGVIARHIVPEEIDGKAVTAIADNAFVDNNRISNLVLPDTIESVGENAFGDFKIYAKNNTTTAETLKNADIEYLSIVTLTFTSEFYNRDGSLNDKKGGTSTYTRYEGDKIDMSTAVSNKGWILETETVTGMEDTNSDLHHAVGVVGKEDITIKYIWHEDNIGPEGKSDKIADKYQIEVSFDVANGTWNDGTTKTIKDVLTLVDENGNPAVDGTATINVPNVGNAPADGFYKGSWSADMATALTKEDQGTNFVYTYKAFGVYNNFTYSINEDNEVVIEGYDGGYKHRPEIPSEIEGLPVTAIADNAFVDVDAISTVTLPNSIKSVGENAFGNLNVYARNNTTTAETLKNAGVDYLSIVTVTLSTEFYNRDGSLSDEKGGTSTYERYEGDRINMGTATFASGWILETESVTGMEDTNDALYKAEGTVGKEDITIKYIWHEDNIGPEGEGDKIADKYQVEVSFDVANGTWNDGTTDTINAVLTLVDENGNPDENGMAVIGIPEVGNVPAEGFVAGNWSANMLDGITKEDQGANFVYNYIEKQVEPTDPTDPTNPTDPSDKPSDGEDTTKPGNDNPDKDVTSGDDKADVDKNGDKTVETGDESDPAMTATLALLAGGAAIGTGMAIRRKRED